MISIQKERITPAQVLIVLWGISIVAGVFLFFQFVDGPADKRVLALRDRLEVLESHLRWVTQTIEKFQDPAKVFDYFSATGRDLDRRFPDSAEKSLIALADYAHKFGVRVSEIRTEKPRRVLDGYGIPLGAGGKACAGVEVSFKFKSEYDNLVKYLGTLRKVLPAYLVVRNMSIENNFSDASRIAGRIDLSLYLLE